MGVRQRAVGLVAAFVVAAGTFAAPALADPPSGGGEPSMPSHHDVEQATRDAADAEAQLTALAARSSTAQRHLLDLQLTVSKAVAAAATAQSALAQAASDLSGAEDSARAAAAVEQQSRIDVRDQAVAAWQQGGSVGEVSTYLMASDPSSLADLVTVINNGALRRRQDLDNAAAASSAADRAQEILARARQAAADASAAADAASVAAAKAVADASRELAALEKEKASADQRASDLRQTATALASERYNALVGAGLGTGTLIGLGTLEGKGVTKDIAEAQRNPRAVALAMLPDYGWDDRQMECLGPLWQGESGWSWAATNTSSGAYGIPQSLPAIKMATAGSDWLINPRTQITWGLTYIKAVYGDPCNAWAKWQARSPHWY